MASIAEKYSSRVIITSDNPRKESPVNIINEIQSGIDKLNKSKVLIIEDRKKAITTESDHAINK